MQLHFLRSGNGSPVIILHGLFGMLDNWKTIGKLLETDHSVYLVDQRNHGRSPHSPEHSFPLMSDDLYQLMVSAGLQKAYIIGHSMGGKTAMQFAVDHPEKIDKLIVVDIGPKRYPEGHDTIFAAMLSLDPAHIRSRAEADALLAKRIDSEGVRQFLMKNLSRNTDGGYHWKCNLEALKANYTDHILAAIKSEHPVEVPALFIRGEQSDYIPDVDWPAIREQFPDSQLVTIQGSGHWVHADQPLAFFRAISAYM
ncbi:MAG: alpha/beta fold hydrolase [Chitinophagales bacterium]